MSIDIRHWQKIHKGDLRDVLIKGDRIVISPAQAEQLLKENKERPDSKGSLKDRFVRAFGVMSERFVIQD